MAAGLRKIAGQLQQGIRKKIVFTWQPYDLHRNDGLKGLLSHRVSHQHPPKTPRKFVLAKCKFSLCSPRLDTSLLNRIMGAHIKRLSMG